MRRSLTDKGEGQGKKGVISITGAHRDWDQLMRPFGFIDPGETLGCVQPFKGFEGARSCQEGKEEAII